MVALGGERAWGHAVLGASPRHHCIGPLSQRKFTYSNAWIQSGATLGVFYKETLKTF